MVNYSENPVIELHNYYICANGNIRGIEIYSRDFITIYGPFISFDNNTHILKSTNNQLIYLPKNYIDNYVQPSVYKRTCEILDSLTNH